MLDTETKRRIDTARDILVGKVPDPKSQVEQITIALIYKFMDDMDKESVELGGKPKFFTREYNKFAWSKIFDPKISGFELVNIYGEAIQRMNQNPNIPQLFRDMFKNAYLPYRDPETLKSFLKIINDFKYDHSERLGDAFEYLLSVLGSQGEAGQFRTPRHIIDFMVEIIDPQKNESILDPACGTAGFLISSYKHILKNNSENYNPEKDLKAFELHEVKLDEIVINNKKYKGDKLSSDDRKRLAENITGYDISPDMVRLSLVNMYLHGFSNPKISEYDTLTSEAKWNEFADVIMANPPFMSPKGGIRPHKRFSIEASRSEVLFVDYIAEHLAPQGRAAVIVPEGIIFQGQTSHKDLRKMLIEKNYLVGVISLPAGVFNPYSGVKTSILWMDRALAKKTDKIIFVKIKSDGFGPGAQRQPIKENDLPDAYRAILAYKGALISGKKFDADKWKNVLVVEKKKIEGNGDYNLGGERYGVEKVYANIKWPMVDLGEVVELVRGVTYSKNDEVGSDGYEILRANNISLNGNVNFDDIKQISRKLELKEKQKLKARDIFICLASGSKSHIGKVAYINKDTDYYFGGFMGVIRIKSKNVEPLYIFYLLRSYKFNEYLGQAISGANINNLNTTILSTYKIPLPPLSIQQEIVAEIENYQKIIEGARQVVENYKPRIDIDPDWPVMELGETCVIKTGKLNANAAVDCGEYPFFTCSKEVFKIDNYAFDCEAILLSGNNATGNFDVKYYKGKFNAYQRTYVITIKNEYVKKLLYGLLQYILEDSLISLQQKSIGGLTRYLTLNMITSIKIPLPDIDTQQKIVNQLQNEQKLVEANKQLIQIFEQKIKDRIVKVWGEK